MSWQPDRASYRGVPIELPNDEGVQWSFFAPNAGGINLETTVFEEHNSYAGTMEADFGGQNVFELLWEIAHTDKFYKKLVAGAQGIFEEFSHLVHGDEFNVAKPDKLSKAEREQFVDLLLSATGRNWAEREEGFGVINYMSIICCTAGIPHYDENLPYMLKGYDHRVFGFSETGKKLTKAEDAIVQRGLEDLWCVVNSCVFDLIAPTHFESMVPLRHNVNFGDPNSPPEFKAIEKSIDRLIANKSGDYSVTVRYAVDDENSGTPAKVKFDDKKHLEFYVKTANEASELAVFWSKFGQKADVQRVKERE